MTENVLFENMEPFENPDLLPLEELKLKIRTDGVVEYVDALGKRWVDDRYFLHYEIPKLYNDNGSEIVGAKEHWMEIINYMIDDLKWLLSLPFYRFWSNIVFNTSILDALVSFLQEAPPFYALENFPNNPEMLKLLETLRYYVLVTFTRLVTNKESPAEYMSRPFMGNLLYEKYIFTIPIIFDLCQLYGRENAKVVEKIVDCLFTLEPQYNNDLERAISCLIEALENIERKFDSCSSYNASKAVSLSERDTDCTNLTLFNLEDMILYVLDISTTTTVFLKNYPPAVSIFHREDFMNKIVLIYENTIPEMYKKLNKLGYNDGNMPKYMELKHRLDVTRIEILKLFRIIIFEPIATIQKKLDKVTETEIKEQVEEYLTYLINAICEKEFITDYDQFYPVQSDLKLLLNICPEVDTMKCNYILLSINAIIGKTNDSCTISNNVDEAIAGPSGIQSQLTVSSDDIRSSNEKQIPEMNSVELASLISEVKDIFYKLDDHFIQMCLMHYNYDSASVINALLDETLPSELQELRDLKTIVSDQPSNYKETSVSEDLRSLDVEQLNVLKSLDKGVHRKTRDVTEVPKDYIIKNYSLVVDEYDDEYDDTYDNYNMHDFTQNDSVEMDSRPFTTPRVLLRKQKIETADEAESEEEDTEVEQNEKDHFIQNPAELRAKAEQRRQATYGEGASSNVTGKPKGRGQEKDVLYNRHQKNIHKATHANHNRRLVAQWKRN